MFTIDALYEICSTAYAKTAYSIGVGAVGTVLLMAFINMVVLPVESLKFLPFIIAFNAALTGYMVIEKTRSFFQNKWPVAMTAGAAATLLACAALNAFFLQLTGLLPISLNWLLAMLAIGMGAGWFGAVLAINYLDLN